MDFFYSLGSLGSSFVGNVFSFYTSMNSASLSGAVDVIVVEQEDGRYLSTPFHVRFGKYRVFNLDEKYVDIHINGIELPFKMQLGDGGVAFFVQKTAENEKVRRYLATSPLPSHTSSRADLEYEKYKSALARQSRSVRVERIRGSNARPPKRRHTTSEGRNTRKQKLKQNRCDEKGITTLGGKISGSLSDTDIVAQCRNPRTQIELISAEFKRSIRLSSDQLLSLNLQYGSNEARFSIATKFQGTAWCACRIYLFKQSEMLVISDVDGTITRSDILGHLIPAIGGTWAHAGVAELYTRINANGYQMVYVSSRSIGLSDHTKTYLKNLKQGTRTLPDGPVLLSPTSVLQAIKTEIIEQRPQNFKIACLTDLKALFPLKEPFVAGFGNRTTDELSYKTVGIPDERIFIINPSGIVSRANRIGYTSDYALMANNLVDFMFPPLRSPNSLILINYSRSADDPFFWWGTSAKLLNQLVNDGLEAYNRKSEEIKKKKAAKK